MRACDRVDEYLDGRLGSSESAAFERHLSDCSGCRAMNEGWRELQLALAAEAADAAPGPPQPGEAARLVERARERRAPATARKGRVFGLAAAVAAAVVLLVVVLSLTSRDATPTEQSAASPVAVSAKLIVGDATTTMEIGERIETPPDGRALLFLGDDRVGVAPRSVVRLLEVAQERTVLRLDRGRLACEVEKRLEGGSFVVDTGRYSVAVRGTRFAVAVAEDGRTDVQVSEGAVEVLEGDQPLGVVEAGRYLTVGSDGRVASGRADLESLALLEALLGEASVAEAPIEGAADESLERVDVEPDDSAGGESAERGSSGRADASRPDKSHQANPIDTWREWVIQGRYDEAEYEIKNYLSSHGADTAAWSLLADCRRKAGRLQGAVEAYRKVFERAGPSEANRARFTAGTILQDRLGDPAAAAALYDEYLSSPGRKPLAAEVRVRRADCLVSLGRRGEAVELLERVVAEHGGTSAAIKARRMLSRIAPAGEGNAPPAQ